MVTTLQSYALEWLEQHGPPTLSARTAAQYAGVLTRHVFPRLGAVPLEGITRTGLRGLLVTLYRDGYARRTVARVNSVIRTILTSAQGDGLVQKNVSLGLVRELRLERPAREMRVRAFTEAQLARVLETAERLVPRYAPIYFTLARTGMRIGEALGLQWDDVNWERGTLEVARTIVGLGGETAPPKCGSSRICFAPPDLLTRLRDLETTRRLEATMRGWALPAWIYCGPAHPVPWNASHLWNVLQRVLRAGGLPRQFGLHSFRHSFAALLLQQGAREVDVQKALGHSAIGLTIDLYGRWAKAREPQGLAWLDRIGGAKGGSHSDNNNGTA